MEDNLLKAKSYAEEQLEHTIQISGSDDCNRQRWIHFESCPCCGSNEFIYRIISASDMEFAQVTVTCAKCERGKRFYYNKKNVCYEEIVADWNKWVGERAGCAVPV